MQGDGQHEVEVWRHKKSEGEEVRLEGDEIDYRGGFIYVCIYTCIHLRYKT